MFFPSGRMNVTLPRQTVFVPNLGRIASEKVFIL